MANRINIVSVLFGLSCLLIRSAGACGSSISRSNMLGNPNMCRQDPVGFILGAANKHDCSLDVCLNTNQDHATDQVLDFTDEEGNHGEMPHTLLYEVQPIPGKGLGLIAMRRISAGTMIITEKPLFTVAMPEMVEGQGHRITDMISELELEFSKLLPEQQTEYLDQHDYRFPGETQTRLLTILRSNAYNTGDNHVGSFPKTARINHSCKPNCGNFWSEKAGHRVIYAESDIEKGEEITVSYIPLLKSIKERQARLQQYGFVCDCSACQSTESSKKRVKISDLLESLEQKLYSAASKKDETNERLIKKAVALVGMIEDEGLTNYLARAFHLASVFNQRRGKSKVAMEWAVKELEIHQWAEVDSEEALATMHYMKTLEKKKQ